MFKDSQFSIGMLLFLTALIATAIRFNYWWLNLVVIEILAGWLIVEILCRNMPKAIEVAQKANSVRHDGTWSSRRAEIEQHDLRSFRSSLFSYITIILVMTHGVWLAVGTDFWVSGINLFEDTEGLSFDDAREKSFSMQVAWSIVIVWILFCALFVKSLYLHLIKKLSISIRDRGQRYSLHDAIESGRRHHLESN